MSHQFVPTGRLTLLGVATAAQNPVPNALRYRITNADTTGTLVYVAFASTAAAAAALAAAPASAGAQAGAKNVFAIAPGTSDVIQLAPDASNSNAAAYFASSAAVAIQPGGNN